MWTDQQVDDVEEITGSVLGRLGREARPDMCTAAVRPWPELADLLSHVAPCPWVFNILQFYGLRNPEIHCHNRTFPFSSSGVQVISYILVVAFSVRTGFCLLSSNETRRDVYLTNRVSRYSQDCVLASTLCIVENELCILTSCDLPMVKILFFLPPSLRGLGIISPFGFI